MRGRLQALGREAQELGDRLDVPVGFRHVDMTEVSGQAGHEPVHVEARAVPLNEPSGRERVPKILKSWAPPDSACMQPGAQADGLAECCECASSGAWAKARSSLCGEKGRRVSAGKDRVAQPGVGRQGGASGLLQGDEARLAELGLPDGENAANEIHVVDVERERLAGSQAGGGQKPEERLERGVAQSRRRTQSVSGGHQVGDLAVAVDVRSRAALACG